MWYGVHSMIMYWSKMNSTINTIKFIFPAKICDDVSYSTFLEGYVTNNNHKKSIKWLYNWLLKWQSFSLMDNTLYLMVCKMGLPCKSYWFSNFEIVFWASKNVQIITGSTIKTFQLKNQHKPSCKSEFPFFLFCSLTQHYLHRIFSFSISFWFH